MTDAPKIPNTMAPPLPGSEVILTPAQKLSRKIAHIRRVGVITIMTCFVGFGGWASVAPLSSAAIAVGLVSPDGSQRTVQHLEGGIIRKLDVKEGDVVQEGQLLVMLDKELAEANYQSRNRKLQRLRVVRDRLLAQERDKREFIPDLAEDLLTDATFIQFVQNETSTFRIKLQLIDEQLSIYDRQEDQILNEIDSLNAQFDGLTQQVVFLDKEIASKRSLLAKGLTRAPELYALERKRAELSSEASAITSTIARANQKNEELKIAKVTFKTESFERIAEQLSELNTEISLAEEALRATQDILSRTEINSPIRGRVLSMHYKTLGGVVRPGEPIMTIVPDDEELIVEARLQPSDIDNVKLGMMAKVQFMSFMSRHMLPFNGEVITIGADVVTDKNTGNSFYPLKVRVSAEDLATRADQIDLRPGMPAEVFVQTGTHTPLQYMFGPIMKSFDKAFREETT